MPRDIQLRVLHQPTNPIDLSLDIFITAWEAEQVTARTIKTCLPGRTPNLGSRCSRLTRLTIA